METTVTQKGQVTLPKHVRDGAGLQPGCRVTVRLVDGRATIELADEAATRAERRAAMQARIDAFRAKHKPVDWGMTTDEFMATIREPLP